ncbi:hypothetical protein ES708_20389 [subsurface metagenome]
MTEYNERLEAMIRRLSNLKQNWNKTPEEIRAMAIKYLELPKADRKLQDLNIISFATGEDWLGLSFKKRPAQEVVLRSIYAMPLNDDQLKIYRRITRNRKQFEAEIEKEEVCLVLGARSGKSLLASICALYESIVKGDHWRKYLNKGEFGYAVIVSTRQKQSEQIIGANCLRLLQNSPKLKDYIKDSTTSELTLKNDMRIVSAPCMSDSYRGVPIYFLCGDEIGHFFVEGPKADSSILGALLPRMSQFFGAKLILISTPSAKQGSLWQYYQEGPKKHKRFTAQSDSLFMNPLINKEFLAKEKARDPDNFLREFLAKFCEKVEAFLSTELVENSLKLAGDLPYKEGNQYYAGIDASGLSLRDKFALAIGHQRGIDVYIDKVKSWNLKDPDPIMRDIEELAGIYHIKKVSIDRYARGWVENALKKIGLFVNVRPSLPSIYVNIKSLMLGGRLFLPDNQAIKQGFINTQAYYGRNNQLSIAHERSDNEGHSDEADAICTCCFDIIEKKEEVLGGILHYDSPGNIWVERNPKSKPEPFNWAHKVTPEEEAKEKEEEIFDWY